MPAAGTAPTTQPRQPTAGAEGRKPPARAQEGRLGWLDALRGVAALFVVFEHLSYHVVRVARVVVPWFSPGLYGVMVFFLVSGYIVPASLERRGSVRGFWIRRLFRLYPLFLVAIFVKITLHHFRLGGLPSGSASHPAVTALAHALMLQDLLGVFSIVNVLWTLSYEMTFYLLLTLLFVAGVHRRSRGFAIGFAVIALTFGGTLPKVGLSHSFLGVTAVLVMATAAIILGLAGAVSGHSRLRLAGAAVVGGTAMLLLLFNGRARAWEGCTILAVMFTGTVLYRAEHRQISWAKALSTAGAVCILGVCAGLWHIAQRQNGHAMLVHERQWLFSILLAGTTFAVAMAWRNRAIPAALVWLGVVSYSVYLMHPLLIVVLDHVPWSHGRPGMITQLALLSGFMATLLVCCWLTYRLVEAPTQRAGRRVAAWLDTRFGPDLVPAGRAAPTGPAAPAASPSAPSARARTPLLTFAGQYVPRREGLDKPRGEWQRHEPGGADPADSRGVVAGRENPAGDDGLEVTDVEHAAVQAGPVDGTEEHAGPDG